MNKLIQFLKIIFIPISFLALLFVIWLIPVKCSFTQTPPPPKHEMRAVWLSTVMRLDWPSSYKLTSEQQKAELIEQLDHHKQNGMNTIIFQVRPAADAFYYSSYEPWSLWFRGEQGKGPEPYYDPLSFMVEECHKRNMEIHAWFNPFRALVDTSKADWVDSLHITKTQPEWFLDYGRGAYFDPGIPQARQHIVKVIMDVVNRYDIDGVHFDDYFYPYKISGQDFPDTLSFARYGKNYPPEKIADWRRSNIDDLIKKTSDSIKALKPYVKFGVSPFGVWRNSNKDPKGSATRAGAPCYDVLYADILKWLQEGWLDYVTPQIYWHIGKTVADYQVLINWWSKHTYGRHLYIGHGVYKINKESKYEAWRNPKEMPNQIMLNRQLASIKGSMFFRSRSFDSNPLGFSNELKENIYRKPALVPVMKWIDSIPPKPPINFKVERYNNGTLLSWENQPGENNQFPNDSPTYYIIYKFKGKIAGNTNSSEYIHAIVREPKLFINKKRGWFQKKYTFIVTGVDRLHNESNESEPFIIKLKD